MARTRTVSKPGTVAAPARPPRNTTLDYLGYCQDVLAEIAAQRAAHERTETAIATLRERVLNGRRWLATHPEEHPRRPHNRELLSRLEWELEQAEWSLRHSSGVLLDLSVALWGAYDAMTPIEQAAVDVSDIERPDHERYWQAMNHWERKEI